jgi:hypothetical protein
MGIGETGEGNDESRRRGIEETMRVLGKGGSKFSFQDL